MQIYKNLELTVQKDFFHFLYYLRIKYLINYAETFQILNSESVI